MSRVDAAGSNDGLPPPVGALRRQAEETPGGTVLVTRQKRWSSRCLAQQAEPGFVGLGNGRLSARLDDATGFLISGGYFGHRRLLPRLAGVR